jgi:hypothetical protein
MIKNLIRGLSIRFRVRAPSIVIEISNVSSLPIIARRDGTASSARAS